MDVTWRGSPLLSEMLSLRIPAADPLLPEPMSSCFTSFLLLPPSRLFCCKAVKVKGTFGETLATARGMVRARLSLDQHPPRRVQVQTYGPVPAGDS